MEGLLWVFCKSWPCYKDVQLYIVLFLTQHKNPMNDIQKDNFHPSAQCLTHCSHLDDVNEIDCCNALWDPAIVAAIVTRALGKWYLTHYTTILFTWIFNVYKIIQCHHGKDDFHSSWPGKHVSHFEYTSFSAISWLKILYIWTMISYISDVSLRFLLIIIMEN